MNESVCHCKSLDKVIGEYMCIACTGLHTWVCVQVCVYVVHMCACGDVIRERRVSNQVQRKLFHVVIPC